jgi:hypothetical protein
MGRASLEHPFGIAEALLGRRPDRVRPFHPSVGGDDSHSFRLWMGKDRMLLKIKKRPGSPIGVYFYTRIKEAGVPVPELIAFDACAGPRGEACAIWEWIEGEPAGWGPDQPCPYDEAEFGELLRRIHELSFDGPFGLLGDDLPVRSFSSHPDLGPVSETWPGFFHCERAARRYFDKGYLNRRESDILSSLPHRLSDELGKAEPRLLHMGDIMHNGNMIIDSGSRRILAVVDYVESMAGDPRWELAWADYYFTEHPFGRAPFDMARFRAAYGTDHDPRDSLGRFYLAAVLLFEKLLFLNPASSCGRWAIETVKGILGRLGGSACPRRATLPSRSMT